MPAISYLGQHALPFLSVLRLTPAAEEDSSILLQTAAVPRPGMTLSLTVAQHSHSSSSSSTGRSNHDLELSGSQPSSSSTDSHPGRQTRSVQQSVGITGG